MPDCPHCGRAGTTRPHIHACGRLPASNTLLEMVVGRGMTMADVAAIYGVSTTTIQRRLPKIGRRATRQRGHVRPRCVVPPPKTAQCAVCHILLDEGEEQHRQLCNYCAQDMGWADM